MSDWTIRATIGGTVYTANRADAPGEADLPALYGVSWGHELEDDDGGWPRRMALTSGSVQLLVAEAADAAHIGPQLTVFLEFITGGVTVDWFAGRASFPEISPHDLGALVTVQVSPYLVDLAGYEAGASNYPQETQGERLERLMPWSLGTDWSMTFAARSASATDLLSLVRETFATGAVDVSPLHLPGTAYELYELRANVDPVTGQLDPVSPWDFLQLVDRVPSPVPLKLREAPDEPGTWELYADPDDPATAPYVIDGTCVAMDATWSRRTDRDANTVHVKLDDGTVVTVTTAETGDVVSAFELDTSLVNPTHAQRLGEAYLPPQLGGLGVASDWAAEAFTVLLDDTAAGWYPPPVVDVVDRAQPLRAVMALSDIQRRHHPDSAVFMVGVVTALELTAAGGTARLQVQLEGHESAYGGAFDDPWPVTLGEVAASIDSLHDSVTFDAIALAREVD